MKKILNIFMALAVVASVVSCKEHYITYDDAEYLIFSDTLSTNAVVISGEPFKVPVSSTVARDYDRTYAVEIIDKGSNAIEGLHYRLKSNTFTIPAGKLSTDIEVYGNYENIEPTDSLGFTLQLVMPEKLKWNLYPEYNRTKVVMFKACPFDINEWGGIEKEPRYCLLTSALLYSFPGTNTSYSRLAKCYKHKNKPNTVVLKSLFYDGYNVELTFNTENPSEPTLTMVADQIIGDELSVLGIEWGDGKLLAQTIPSGSYVSSYNACQKYAQLYVRMYIKNFSELVGYVGDFYNILEWVSKEEAEEIMREGL
ncbi:MAG: DUF4984 domain-containing protein [Alistipes sp.]|nr:DUF4984 domain-containing protein [Alistipes sp.]